MPYAHCPMIAPAHASSRRRTLLLANARRKARSDWAIRSTCPRTRLRIATFIAFLKREQEDSGRLARPVDVTTAHGPDEGGCCGGGEVRERGREGGEPGRRGPRLHHRRAREGGGKPGRRRPRVHRRGARKGGEGRRPR